jgi:hypothetical protein
MHKDDAKATSIAAAFVVMVVEEFTDLNKSAIVRFLDGGK